MTERPRELNDFKGVGQFEANFRFKGYVRFGPSGTEILYYNFAAGSHHTKKLRSIRFKLNFIF